MTTKSNFEMYELEAFIGSENLDDFDIDAIVDEATEVDYRTGNRVWKEGIDLSDICQRNALTEKWAVSTWKDDRNGVPCGDEMELFDDEESARERYADIDLVYSWNVEYNTSNRLCIDTRCKQLAKVDVDADGEIFGDFDVVESESYGYDEHELEGAWADEAEEMLERLDWQTIESYMDRDIAERLHMELAPCSDKRFLMRYMDEHETKHGEPFEIN